MKEFSERVVDSLDDALLVIDLKDYTIISANEVALKQLKLRKEDLTGKICYEITHRRSTPCEPPHHICPLQEMLKTGKAVTVGHTHFDKDNNEMHVEVSVYPMRNQEGKIVQAVHVARDFTERKKMEEELRESEEKYKLIFKNSPDGIITLDPTGNITSVNDVVLSYGYKKEELVGKSFLDFVPFVSEKHRPILDRHVSSITSGKIAQGEMELSTPKGKRIMWFRVSPLKKKGEIVGFQLILIDITKRKKAESALRKSEERYRTLFESTREGLITAGPDGRILSANPAAATMLNYESPEELVGRHTAELYADQKQIKIVSEELMRTGYIEDLEIVTKKKDGMHAYVLASITTQRDKEGNILRTNGIFRDITERKKTEKALKESEKRLRDVIDTSPDAIVWVGTTGKITLVNKKGFELTGFSEKDLVGKDFMDVEALTQESKEKILENFLKRIEGIDVPPYEVEVIAKNGEVIPAEISASPIFEGDKIVGTQSIFRDLRERKKVEEKIRESEKKHRLLYETLRDGISATDMDGHILECNQAYADMLGYSKDELKKLTYQQLTPKQWHQMEANVVKEQILKRGYSDEYEKEYMRKDGTVFPISMRTWLIRGEDGKPKGMWGIVRDITERKQMEERLRESEERFRNIYENIQDPFVVWVGRKGRLLEYNEAFKEQTGYTDEELKDKTFLDFVHPDDHAMILEKYRTKYPEEGFPLVYEIRALNKKGEIIPLEISVSPYKVKGKVVGIEAIGRNITERKQMEEKLRQYSEHLEELVQKRTEELLESEKRYSVLVEEASDGVTMIQDGKVVFVNKKISEIIDYSRDELIGLPFEKVVDEKYLQLAMEGYMRVMQGEKVVPAMAEVELIAKTGEHVPVEGAPTLINYQGRPAVLVVMRDIRERKRMEEQRLKLEKLAAIGELATMVGHDLRNPLQAIENATYCLNNELPRLPPSTTIPQKTIEMLQIINNSVNYADKIIRDLHDFSTTKKPTLKKTNINTIVKETLSQVETPENVELTTELGHLPRIKVDKDMMKRVFMNLALNGIQAMENGGTLKISTKKTKGSVEVSFKDTGTGMPKENMKKIFTPFYTTKAKGMGMGLAICKKLVDSHGGTIMVESEKGKGTTFTVKLPLQRMEVRTIGEK